MVLRASSEKKIEKGKPVCCNPQNKNKDIHKKNIH